jgi:hypothetical protein
MARRRDYSTIQPGSDPTRNVARIYEGRETSGYPRNPEPSRRRDPPDNSRHHEQGARPGDDQNNSAPQFEEDGRSANYNNDATGWVRGCRSGSPDCFNESAEHKPFFDKKQAYRTDRRTGMADQIRDYDKADHWRHHSEFERHNANGSITHDQMAHDFSKRHIPSYERKGELGGEGSKPAHRGPWLKDKQ